MPRRYAEKVWKRYFENDVQYFNRVQRPEWLEMFQQAGFEMVEEELVCRTCRKTWPRCRQESINTNPE